VNTKYNFKEKTHGEPIQWKILYVISVAQNESKRENKIQSSNLSCFIVDLRATNVLQPCDPNCFRFIKNP
jgi:hypothetical protein